MLSLSFIKVAIKVVLLLSRDVAMCGWSCGLCPSVDQILPYFKKELCVRYGSRASPLFWRDATRNATDGAHRPKVPKAKTASDNVETTSSYGGKQSGAVNFVDSKTLPQSLSLSLSEPSDSKSKKGDYGGSRHSDHCHERSVVCIEDHCRSSSRLEFIHARIHPARSFWTND